MNANLIKYRFVKDVTDCILESGGIVFGGAVRDRVSHNMAAEKYYKRCIEDLGMSKKEACDKYVDKEFLSEFVDRLLLPKDIDCYISNAEFDKFQELLKERGMYEMRKVEMSPNTYIEEFADGIGLKYTFVAVKLIHNPLYVDVLDKGVRDMDVFVDVLHCPVKPARLDPPFCFMDFECNSLIIDGPGNIRISRGLAGHHKILDMPLKWGDVFQRVCNDIVERRARPVTKVHFHRGIKMLKRGWKIEDVGGKTPIEFVIEKVPSDVCAFCRDELDSDGQVKTMCCNLRYHHGCFKGMVSHRQYKNECPGCRGELSVESLKRCIFSVL